MEPSLSKACIRVHFSWNTCKLLPEDAILEELVHSQSLSGYD